LGVGREFTYLGRTLRKKNPWLSLDSHGCELFMRPSDLCWPKPRVPSPVSGAACSRALDAAGPSTESAITTPAEVQNGPWLQPRTAPEDD
jgi:hypothetical protein